MGARARGPALALATPNMRKMRRRGVVDKLASTQASFSLDPRPRDLLRVSDLRLRSN
jgi:hypothetical protein